MAMCEICRRIEEMDEVVVDFMVRLGGLPAYKQKDEEDEGERIFQQLYRRLRRLQIGLESTFLQVLRELGYIPGSSLEQKDLVERTLGPVFEEMEKAIADKGVEAANVGRFEVLQELARYGLQVNFQAFSDYVVEELQDRIYTFSRDTFSRIKGDFAMSLARAYMDGKGIDEIAEWIKPDFQDLRDNRLRLIARTEVQGAQNVGIHRTMKEHNVRYKQWLTVRDSRVRGRNPKDKADHVKLHGQVVRFDEPFSNGLMHPLDRSKGRANIHEWINCRCRMRPYIPRPGEAIIKTPYYPTRRR